MIRTEIKNIGGGVLMIGHCTQIIFELIAN